MKQAHSGAVLLEDVILDDGSLVAASGTCMDTRMIVDLRERGISRVRIEAQPKPEDRNADAHAVLLDCVKRALREVIKRFRHCDLEEPHVRALFHACALSDARKKMQDTQR